MKKRLKDLLYGASCAFRGLHRFFSRPRLWPYAVPPLLCVILLYAVILACIVFLVDPWLRGLIDRCSFPEWLSWLQAVLNWSRIAIMWIAVPLLLLVFIGSFYEMFGNMLFDLLVGAFEKEEFPAHPGADQKYGRVVRLTAGYVSLTILSNLMKIPLMLLWLIPFVGKPIYYLYCSGVCGRSYFHDSAIRQGFHVSVLRKQVEQNRFAVLGFGIVAFLLESIPFLMPGLVVGGSILYHTRLYVPEAAMPEAIPALPERKSLPPAAERIPLPPPRDVRLQQKSAGEFRRG